MHIYFIGQKGISANSLQDSSELRVRALAIQAAKKGHNVRFAATNGYCVRGSVDTQKVHTTVFPSLDPRIPGGYVYTLFSCIAALFIRPETLVIQGWKAAIVMRPLLFLIPSTCTIWTIEALPQIQSPFAQKMLSLLLPFIASGVDQVCAVSRTVQYRLLTAYSIKTTYIPDGYTAPELVDISPKTAGLTKEKYAVLLTEETKEIQRIARAFASAKTRKKLVVFGSGRSSKTIIYIDAPPMSRLATSIVRQAGVVIAADPAYSPLLLQAMDAKRQVIATTDSLHEELLGVSATYYVSNDYKQLTGLIKESLKTLSINKAAALRAKHHFSWNTIGQEYERVYTHKKAILVPFDSLVRKSSFKIAV